MSDLDATLIAKLRQLPLHRQAEVEDFIDFLHEREEARRLTNAAATAAEPAFAKVWENDEDAVYDAL